MARLEWADERIEEKMNAVDQTFDRLHDDLGGVREELRGFRSEVSDGLNGLRSDFSNLQGRLVQIGFGLVAALLAACIALIGTVAGLLGAF